MSISIRACPKCSSMIISDSSHCPTCGHVVDEKANGTPLNLIPETEIRVDDEEMECRQCGEMVKVGLVRCWKCGAFTSEEMERLYHKRKASPTAAIFSATPNTQAEQDDRTSQQAFTVDEDDFTLDGSVGVEYGSTGWSAGTETLSPDQGADQGYAVSMPNWETPEPAAAETIPLAPLPQSSFATSAPSPLTEATASELPDLAGTTPASGSATPPLSDIMHSDSNAGDALLQAAIEEEKESAAIRAKGGRRRVIAPTLAPGSFLVFCPNGHRIQVQDKHRGRAGRCPQCKSVFFVPASVEKPEGAENPEAPAIPQRHSVGKFASWMFEMRLHTVNPTKLKLKPGGMAAEYDVADIAFSEDSLLITTVFKRGGALAALQEKKKKAATRDAVADHLEAGNALTKLPAAWQTVVTRDDVSQLKIVQPPAPNEESLFAGIPVFGVGRIVVRLPVVLEGNSRAYLSFNLSEYREFARLLENTFGISRFGEDQGIPLGDKTSTVKCHYSELDVPVLDNRGLEFYENDPALKPTIVARKCAGCGIIVSEDSRRKEKIGGKTEASIAKAPCPKCKQKFGDKIMLGLDGTREAPKFGFYPE